MLTREELESLPGIKIKRMLQEQGIAYDSTNNKAENIELLLKAQLRGTKAPKQPSTETVQSAEIVGEKTGVISKKLNLDDVQALYTQLVDTGSIESLDELGVSTATVYEGTPVTYNDLFTMEKIDGIYKNFFMLVNANEKVAGYGYLVPHYGTRMYRIQSLWDK